MSLYGNYKSDGFYFITAWSMTLVGMQSWLETQELQEEYTDYYADADRVAFHAYRIKFNAENAIPTNYLIDRDGNVRFYLVGEIVEDEWAGYIEELL